jgi:hypothetical protein
MPRQRRCYAVQAAIRNLCRPLATPRRRPPGTLDNRRLLRRVNGQVDLMSPFHCTMLLVQMSVIADRVPSRMWWTLGGVISEWFNDS